jgi:hypothetical protein
MSQARSFDVPTDMMSEFRHLLGDGTQEFPHPMQVPLEAAPIMHIMLSKEDLRAAAPQISPNIGIGGYVCNTAARILDEVVVPTPVGTR